MEELFGSYKVKRNVHPKYCVAFDAITLDDFETALRLMECLRGDLPDSIHVYNPEEARKRYYPK